MKYQPHIDGLRSLAVVAVIIFHLQPELLPGGYLGVDIFFVISGYLITAILREKTTNGVEFSFIEFYIRRLRRLYPAVASTILITLPAALAILPSTLLPDLGRQVAAVLLNVSNIYYWHGAGYWDDSSAGKVFLHTWSLSVEEQFYILWPVFIHSISWTTDKEFFYAIGSVLLLSLMLNVCYATTTNEWLQEDATTAFFWTPFRMFEFALGGLGTGSSFSITTLPANTSKLDETQDALKISNFEKYLTVLGFLLTCGPILYPRSDSLPLFLVAALPCIGSSILIQVGHRGLCHRILSQSLLVRVGVISYSLYLIHWPLIVLYKFITLRELGKVESFGIFVLTLLLGFLSYKFVEQPFRSSKSSDKLQISKEWRFILGCLSISTMIIMSGLSLSFGLIDFKSATSMQLTATQVLAGKLRRHERVNHGCKLSEYYFDAVGTLRASASCHLDRKLQVLVYGNSHEEDGYNSFDYVYGNDESVNIISFGATNRLVQKGILPFECQSSECSRVEILYSEDFLVSLDVFVISFFGAFGETEYPDSLHYKHWSPWFVAQNILERNHDIHIIAFGPYIGRLTHDCHVLYNQLRTLDACKSPEFIASSTKSLIDTYPPSTPPQSFVNFLTKRRLEYLYIDVISMLCPAGILSSCIVEAGGEPWAYDRHHKSMALSELIGALMLEKYGETLQGMGFTASSSLTFKTIPHSDLVLDENTTNLVHEIETRALKNIQKISNATKDLHSSSNRMSVSERRSVT